MSRASWCGNPRVLAVVGEGSGSSRVCHAADIPLWPGHCYRFHAAEKRWRLERSGRRNAGAFAAAALAGFTARAAMESLVAVPGGAAARGDGAGGMAGTAAGASRDQGRIATGPAGAFHHARAGGNGRAATAGRATLAAAGATGTHNTCDPARDDDSAAGHAAGAQTGDLVRPRRPAAATRRVGQQCNARLRVARVAG